VAAVQLVSEEAPVVPPTNNANGVNKKKLKFDDRISKYFFPKEELLQIEISVFGNALKRFKVSKDGTVEGNRLLPPKHEDHDARRKRETAILTEASKASQQKKEELKKEATKQELPTSKGDSKEKKSEKNDKKQEKELEKKDPIEKEKEKEREKDKEKGIYIKLAFTCQS